jgi:DNA-binding NarL/FixJ family response regulator
MPIIRVLIIEDPLFSKGLASLIIDQPLFMIAGEARNSAEAKELLKAKKADLVILDLNLGDEDGLGLIGELKALTPGIRILVLSIRDERYYTERALRVSAQMVGKVYRSATGHERFFGMGKKAPPDQKIPDQQTPVRELSNRQFQIFSLIGKGLGTAEIAVKLELSPKTVDAHKEHIKQKLCCPSSQELRRLAVEWINR